MTLTLGLDMNWFLQLVTGKDGQTHDLVKWSAVLGTLQGLGLTAYDTIVNHVHFDIQSFGIGLGALLAAVGAALKFKDGTEASSAPSTPPQP